ncbi:MAG: glycoside hydrolase family 28 protein, partial [Verrucomicrobia bacterium]
MKLKLTTALCIAAAWVVAATNPMFNVRDYGATGDGKSLDSPAIDKAIAACAGAGGGTVWIPA